MYIPKVNDLVMLKTTKELIEYAPKVYLLDGKIEKTWPTLAGKIFKVTHVTGLRTEDRLWGTNRKYYAITLYHGDKCIGSRTSDLFKKVN